MSNDISDLLLQIQDGTEEKVGQTEEAVVEEARSPLLIPSLDQSENDFVLVLYHWLFLFMIGCF